MVILWVVSEPSDDKISLTPNLGQFEYDLLEYLELIELTECQT